MSLLALIEFKLAGTQRENFGLSVSFEQLVEMMVDADLNRLQKS